MSGLEIKEKNFIFKIYDSLMLPFRGLFLGTEGKFGLSSIRDERMCMVAAYCTGRVLDIGCGPGNYFIKKYIGEKKGIGVDIYSYDGVENIVKDMAKLPYENETFDTVTLIAVGGHIPKQKREDEFKEFARVLKIGGKLIMTEGEPISQYLRHKWLHFYMKIQGKNDVDTERGMDEDEQFCMPKNEIMEYLNSPPLSFVFHKSFQWKLNNIYIARKCRL